MKTFTAMHTASQRRPWWSRWLALTAVTSLSLLVTIPAPSLAGTFGTRCQKTFQNGWQKTLPYAYARCGGFNDELDDTDTKKFYYNLNTSGLGFTTNDHLLGPGGVDSVDLFYVSTHGGTSDTDARLVLYQQNTRSFSSQYRFGDEARKVKIYSQYACKTLRKDGLLWTRWRNAFHGGVYIVTGSHDKVYDGYTTDETGEDYADGLQKQKSVKWAWFDGNSDWWADQALAVVATGEGENDCKLRRNYFTWQNITSFSRLRDGEVKWWCRSRYDG